MLCPEMGGRYMHYRNGVIMVLTAAVLWSLMGLMIRQIEVAGTWALLFWRSAGMIPVLLIVIRLRKGPGVLGRVRAVGWPGVVGGIGLVLAFAGATHHPRRSRSPRRHRMILPAPPPIPHGLRPSDRNA